MAGTGKLESTLKKIRKRLLKRALLLSLSWALCATLLAAALVRVTVAGLSPYLLPAVFVLVFAALSALQLWRLPGLLEIARRADSRFSLDERLSAAFEAGGGARVGTVAALLQEDAVNHLSAVDPVALVRIRPGRNSWLALGAVCLLSGTAFLLPLSDPLPETAHQATTGQPNGNQPAGDPLNPAALPPESELLSALAPTLQDLQELAEPDEEVAPEHRESVGEAADNSPESSDPDDRNAADRSGSQLTESSSDDAQLAQAEPGAQPSDFTDSDPSRNFMEPDPSLLARLEERRQQMLNETAGMEVASLDSAAQQSDRGAGDPGGDAPEAGAAAGEDVEFGFDGSTLELSQQELRDGESTTTRASPETEVGGTGTATGGTFSSFVRTAEAPQQQPVTPAMQRLAVREYFLPEASE